MCDVLHVMPVGDVIEHVTCEDCICGPSTELVERAHQGDGWIYVHYSLDGREQTER